MLGRLRLSRTARQLSTISPPSTYVLRVRRVRVPHGDHHHEQAEQPGIEDGGPRAAARRARAPGQARPRSSGRSSSPAPSSRVLAIAGGIGYAVVQANKPSYWEAAKNAKLVAPANTTGTQRHDGRHRQEPTPRRPSRCTRTRAARSAPSSSRPSARPCKKDFDAGKFKIQYVGATFIDNKDNGEGSKNALSALGAALNVSPEAFLEYKTALYSTKYHPDETDDKFKDDAYLIKVADTVPALKGNTKFQNAVKNGTYDRWALAMSKTFDDNKDGVTGTPSLKMDGKTLDRRATQERADDGRRLQHGDRRGPQGLTRPTELRHSAEERANFREFARSCVVPVSNLIGRDQSIQISTSATSAGPQLPLPAPPYGRQGRGGDRCPGRPARRRAARPRRRRGPRLPARRRLRRPAARRHPAVDPGDAHRRGDTRLRARPGHRGQLGRRQGQGVHAHRRQGLHHRHRRHRPHRQGRRPRPAPATDYCFRFSAGGTDSPVGAHPHRAGGGRRPCPACASAWSPAPTGRPATSPRTATSRPAATWTPSLHLGDYIYEYGTGEYGAARHRRPPQHAPAHEILTLADYRTRHGQYKTDPDLQALHARPRSSRSGTTTSSPTTPGRAAPRTTPRAPRAPGRPGRPAAKQAYFEWMPVRPAIAGTTYRRLRFGKLADLSLLDLRSFRSQQVAVGNGTVDDPDRTITGRAQLDWLKAGLKSSDTTWRLVGNSVMISPFAIGSLSARPAQAARQAARPAAGGPRPQHRPVGRLHRRPPRTARPPALERASATPSS